MKTIELHVIQNMSPSCLNRDENNIPKSSIFGGMNRARVSSQCWKRAARFHPFFVDYCKSIDMPLSSRTWRTAKRFYDVLISKKYNYSEEHAKKLAICIVMAFTDIKDTKTKITNLKEEEVRKIVKLLDELKNRNIDDILTNTALFVSDSEIEKIVSHVLDAISSEYDLVNDLNKENKLGPIFKSGGNSLKSYEFEAPSLDVAFNGRMFASSKVKNMNVDAATQWAQIISTNAIEQELDYFSALDDLKPDEQPGADMIGEIGFNSPCFYRYMNINLDIMEEHYGEVLGDEAPEFIKNASIAYLNAAIKSIPEAKQNSMAAHNIPSMVFIVVRDGGCPVSLANAFVMPVQANNDKNLIQKSIEALDDYWGRAIPMDGAEGVVKQVIIEIENSDLKNLDSSRAKDLKDVFKQVKSAIPL